jgi:hypothetical protein
MILGFAGRLRIGKTELAKVCQEHGYEIMSFATPLKELCADLLSVTIDELNSLKNNCIKINILISNELCEKISKETDIPIDIVEDVSLGKVIVDAREMLQFIGTDLIRKYNEDWHVNKIKERLDKDKNYVFDDVRFKNEKKMMNSLGGDCWFVIRPKIDQVSNHESETSLTWKDCFNKIIINDKTLEYLRFKWENFLDDYTNSVSRRDDEFNRILEMYPQNGIEKLSALDMLFISEDFFTYHQVDIKREDVAEFKITKWNGLQINYKDGVTIEVYHNMLVIEDLKMLM